MQIGFGLGLNRRGFSAETIPATVTSLDPFSATATAPDGQQFVAGAVTIIIMVKPDSFGEQRTVAATIAANGVITEDVSGSFAAAVQYAGWLEGETPTARISGAQTEPIPAVSGVVIDLASVAVAGQATGTSTDTLTYTGMACDAGSEELLAFMADRGPGGTQFFTINGTAVTEMFSNVSANSSDRIRGGKITHPGTITSTTVVLDGLSAATSLGGICVLLSANNAGTTTASVTIPANGATSASQTISVEEGDYVLVLIRGTATGYGAITWTGVDQLQGSTQLGTATMYGAAAGRLMTATNASYSVGFSSATGPNLQTLSVFIIKPAV